MQGKYDINKLYQRNTNVILSLVENRNGQDSGAIIIGE